MRKSQQSSDVNNRLGKEHYHWVLIGASAGGLEALLTTLSVLPEDFCLPVLVVRHQAPDSTVPVDEIFNRHFHLRTKYAETDEYPKAGTVYLASPDRHLLIDEAGRMQLSVGEKVRFSRPSIDRLFETAASVPNRKAIAVVMTGGNSDGAEGLRKVVDAGGIAVVQHPESAECDIMPKAAIQAVPEAKVIWRDQIGVHLWNLVRDKK